MLGVPGASWRTAKIRRPSARHGGRPLGRRRIGDNLPLVKLWGCAIGRIQRQPLPDFAIWAGVAASLASNERPTARNEYRRAWQEVVENGDSLPPCLELIVTRRGQVEVVCGALDAPTDIIVTEDGQRFEARILSAAGQPVLEVGPTATERISALLEETGAFMPRRLDGIGVQLLVDGEPFVPRPSDTLLTSQGLDWLPEVMVIGNELRGEQLERGIQSSTNRSPDPLPSGFAAARR